MQEVKKITLKIANPLSKELLKRTALEEDCTTTISDECICVDEDGKYLIGMFKIPGGIKEIHSALKKIRFLTNTRTGGMLSTSRIFGFSPRIELRQDYCTRTSLDRQFPRESEVIQDFALKLEEFYREFSGKTYEEHREKTDKVLPDYKMKGTVFTSGIINKNNPLPYHKDRGNFENCYSCMIMCRDGILGGKLSCPEYGVKFDIPDGYMIMFDGQKLIHGVTPIVKLKDNAYRYTLVYYSLKGFWKCLTEEEELKRVRNKKTELYLKRSKILQKK